MVVKDNGTGKTQRCVFGQASPAISFNADLPSFFFTKPRRQSLPLPHTALRTTPGHGVPFLPRPHAARWTTPGRSVLNLPRPYAALRTTSGRGVPFLPSPHAALRTTPGRGVPFLPRPHAALWTTPGRGVAYLPRPRTAPGRGALNHFRTPPLGRRRAAVCIPTTSNHVRGRRRVAVFRSFHGVPLL
eukprot:gene15699-biopygen5209